MSANVAACFTRELLTEPVPASLKPELFLARLEFQQVWWSTHVALAAVLLGGKAGPLLHQLARVQFGSLLCSSGSDGEDLKQLAYETDLVLYLRHCFL